MFVLVTIAQALLTRFYAQRTRRMLTGLASDQARLTLLAPDLEKRLIDKVAQVHIWTEAQEFDFRGMFALEAPDFPSAHFAMWQQQAFGRLLVAGVSIKSFVDVISVLSDDVMLSTGMRAALLFGPDAPNSYRQAFPGADTDEIWRRHLEAEEYLLARWHIRNTPLTLSAEELFIRHGTRDSARLLSELKTNSLIFRWSTESRRRFGVPIQEQEIAPPRLRCCGPRADRVADRE